ncbi:phospholipid/cholesterol/gamma-HCH transport system permease protein [Sphingomonas guangdongensis]|uniref:Phospholipid/cholesterol/gamma-HCH transport system permease protein n=1 Tax=Sphingomonas guangdongensis TaxID=1141890 RepID=A0A285QH38_9SPHN|nr:ABC transporter permease [Sphingomonas guangdongensis]SOB80784.1 phospholipid/cholesterol/gamma-HCH transport system permease protein [Sphingomonas guangdongensis]
MNADFTDEGGTLRFRGSLSLAQLGNLPERLDQQAGARTLDLSGIERIDTVGAWVVHRHATRTGAEITGLSDDGRHLMEQVQHADEPVAVPAKPASPLRRVVGEIGDATATAGRTMLGLLAFMGATTIAFGSIIRHPARFRFNATVHRFEVVGVSALGIVGLMSFLIGIVIAQQGAVQLRQFGAEVFTINLVGRITLRELGVLMTAIMVAGRSGSAFAAQLGTMKLTEEIDAMRTIGVSPMESLVVPRTLAAILLMPLLGFYSSLIAIIGGGLLCWLQLDIPPVTFMQRIREVVPITDLYVGLVKAPVFGAIIAIAGCFQGMQVEGDAEQVGSRTTAAVVQAIFLVIVLDAFFAVFFTWIGWI